MTGRRWRAGDDRGASLMLALLLTTVLGLTMAAVVAYSSASLRATRSLDTRAGSTYDVDGALKTGVNQVRAGGFNNSAGQACADVTVPAADGAPIRVTCTAGPGTGGASEQVPVAAANRPGQAVLTLGTPAGGAGIAQRATGAFRVQGKVFSASGITAGTGSVESLDAAVVAKSACTGTVVSRSALGAVVPTVCSTGAVVPDDPDYAQPGTGLVHRPVPTCNSGTTVEFEPGYYDDAVGLSALMSSTGPCPGRTFHFRPAPGGGVGIYYFDFHNGEGGGLPTGPRVWTINDSAAEVVGGTPQGWQPDATSPTVPGACVSPLRSTTNGGVRFVFGGDSRLSVKAGAVELCGQYSTAAPPIVLDGAKAGADVVTGPVTLTTDGTGTNPTDGPTFAAPDRIAATDGNAAVAVIDADSRSSGVVASVIVAGYVPATAIPAGSVLTRAQLIVVHRDENSASDDRLSLLQVSAVPTRSGAPLLANVPQPTIYQDRSTTGYHTDTLDLLAGLSAEVHNYGFTGLRVRYDAAVAAKNKVTERLDSIRLVLAWRPPAVRGQQVAVNGGANCVGAITSGCALLETAAGATLALQGTVYAPYAAVTFTLTGVSAPVVSAGLIARTLAVTATPAAGYTGAMVAVPNASPGPQQLEVYLRALRAEVVVGTTRVRLPATDPTALVLPGRRSVVVLSWTIRRS